MIRIRAAYAPAVVRVRGFRAPGDCNSEGACKDLILGRVRDMVIGWYGDDSPDNWFRLFSGDVFVPAAGVGEKPEGWAPRETVSAADIAWVLWKANACRTKLACLKDCDECDATAAQVLGSIDTNHDGQITWDEFRAAMGVGETTEPIVVPPPEGSEAPKFDFMVSPAIAPPKFKFMVSPAIAPPKQPSPITPLAIGTAGSIALYLLGTTLLVAALPLAAAGAYVVATRKS
jgi:hypothetical protein